MKAVAWQQSALIRPPIGCIALQQQRRIKSLVKLSSFAAGKAALIMTMVYDANWLFGCLAFSFWSRPFSTDD
jgi:hypothetical protein